MEQVASSDYYAKLSEEIKHEFVSYGSASGVDANHFDYVFSEILPPTQIQQDVETSVHQVFTGTVTALEYSHLTEQLEQSFYQYARQKGMEISDESAVQYLAKTCIATYSDYVNLPYAGQISNLIINYGKPIQFVSFVLLALCLALAAFIFVINRWKHRALRFYIFALSGSLLMTIAVPIAALLTNKIDKVSIASPALYDFAVTYLYGFLHYFFFGAFCLAVILTILGMVFAHLKRKAESKESFF